MKIKIVTDSCSDLQRLELEDENLSIASLTIKIGEIEYKDDINFPQKDFIEKVKQSNEVAKSSCPSPIDFLNAFCDEQNIFVVTISSELSGSYNSALNAKSIYLEKHPDANIHVINSKSAAAGEALIYFKLKSLISQNLDFNSIKNSIEDFISDMTTAFVLDDLDTLIKNGRLNTLQAIVTKTLNLKPVMIATRIGTIEKHSMARGTKKALKELLNIVKDKYNSTKETLVLTHCNCLERATILKTDIENLNFFKNIVLLDTFGTSTTYANDGGIIIAF